MMGTISSSNCCRVSTLSPTLCVTLSKSLTCSLPLTSDLC